MVGGGGAKKFGRLGGFRITEWGRGGTKVWLTTNLMSTSSNAKGNLRRRPREKAWERGTLTGQIYLFIYMQYFNRPPNSA